MRTRRKSKRTGRGETVPHQGEWARVFPYQQSKRARKSDKRTIFNAHAVGVENVVPAPARAIFTATAQEGCLSPTLRGHRLRKTPPRR